MIAWFVLTTGMGTYALDGDWSLEKHEQLQQVLELWEYDQLPVDIQQKITAVRFEKMLTRKTNHDALISAIEANDYDSLPESAKEKIDAEKFAKKVERHAQMQEQKTRMTSIIQSGDVEAFKIEMAAIRAERGEKILEKTWELRKRIKDTLWNKREPSEEKLQEKFDTLSEYYVENGELPQKWKWFGRHKGRRGHWGVRW